MKIVLLLQAVALLITQTNGQYKKSSPKAYSESANLNIIKNMEVYAIGKDENKLEVYKDGVVAVDFDPSIESSTCHPAPKQTKIYDAATSGLGLAPSKEKKIFQDFTVRLPSDKLISGSFNQQYDVKVSVTSKNDPMNPEVFPKTLKLG